jgi:DNA polymerase III alpha subunit
LPLPRPASIRSFPIEPAVALKPMTPGGEFVEGYSHVGLTPRAHPLRFLRGDLKSRRIVTCEDAMNASDGKRLEAAGLVLVRQRPGSAIGVMFITIEDETGHANLAVWVKVFDKYRCVVLGAGMIGVYGKIQPTCPANLPVWDRGKRPFRSATSFITVRRRLIHWSAEGS